MPLILGPSAGVAHRHGQSPMRFHRSIAAVAACYESSVATLPLQDGNVWLEFLLVRFNRISSNYYRFPEFESRSARRRTDPAQMPCVNRTFVLDHVKPALAGLGSGATSYEMDYSCKVYM